MTILEFSDADLVAKAKSGDSVAFDQLMERHRPRLVRLLTGLLWDADEAETVAQETFVRVVEQIADYREEHEFRAWIAGIGINLARQTLRTRARRAAVVDPAALEELAQAEGRNRGVLSGILRRELHFELHRAMDQLPVSLREVLVLHEFEKMDYPEISQLTGVSEGTLRVRAHRARALLKESLGPVVDTWWQSPAP